MFIYFFQAARHHDVVTEAGRLSAETEKVYWKIVPEQYVCIDVYQTALMQISASKGIAILLQALALFPRPSDNPLWAPKWDEKNYLFYTHYIYI